MQFYKRLAPAGTIGHVSDMPDAFSDEKNNYFDRRLLKTECPAAEQYSPEVN
ncbi:MAG: hypothetical protein LBV47_07980 [Bacteroidales bacterium]|nr:hypothetical protein [Bacteroidales bacterium]